MAENVNSLTKGTAFRAGFYAVLGAMCAVIWPLTLPIMEQIEYNRRYYAERGG